jgi:hypothetical protein
VTIKKFQSHICSKKWNICLGGKKSSCSYPSNIFRRQIPNDNHPRVCRLRHALTAVRTGSISCVCILFVAVSPVRRFRTVRRVIGDLYRHLGGIPVSCTQARFHVSYFSFTILFSPYPRKRKSKCIGNLRTLVRGVLIRLFQSVVRFFQLKKTLHQTKDITC